MAKDRSAEYAQAIDDLDARHAQGEISQGVYEVERTKLLKAAEGKPPTSTGVKVLVTIAVLIAAFIVLRIIGAIYNALYVY